MGEIFHRKSMRQKNKTLKHKNMLQKSEDITGKENKCHYKILMIKRQMSYS